jgi:pimeloyl-ACP methyl ester carboxylesterase
MERYDFEDIELTYELRGGGQPVVLVHASSFVSWYNPLVEHLDGFATLRYRRRLRSVGPSGYRPLTVEEDAEICRRLMDHIGWGRAHIVGHSYGALVALQMAIDAPERVASVALLEPAARGISSAEQVVAALRPIIAAYRSGDNAAAVDGFLRHVCGDGYRASLDSALPGAYEQALGESDLFFQSEMAAVQSWSFGPDEARLVTQPILNVVGRQSVPRFVQAGELVQSWFPDAERLFIPDAGHLLMVQNPNAVADGLGDFFRRHPIDTLSVGASTDLRTSSRTEPPEST